MGPLLSKGEAWGGPALPWETVRPPGPENCDCLSWVLTGGGPISALELSGFLLILSQFSHPVNLQEMVGKLSQPLSPAPLPASLFSPEQGPAGEGEAAGVL